MPRGRMRWFDPRTGEGRVVAAGREYPTQTHDVDPRARTAGARVRFDVQRVGGVRTAVRVRLRAGLRTSPKQGRFGDLSGASRPDAKGRAPLTHQRPRVDPTVPGHPTTVVRRWLTAADTGRLDGVLPLYAPDAVVHASDGDHDGRPAVRAYLLDSGLLTRGWDPAPQGEGALIRAVRAPTATDAGRSSRFRIAHGQIAEQWVDPTT